MSSLSRLVVLGDTPNLFSFTTSACNIILRLQGPSASVNVNVGTTSIALTGFDSFGIGTSSATFFTDIQTDVVATSIRGKLTNATNVPANRIFGVISSTMGVPGWTSLQQNAVYRVNEGALTPGSITDTGTRIGINTATPLSTFHAGGSMRSTSWVALSGENLTNINANNIATGTIATNVGGTGLTSYAPNTIYKMGPSGSLVPSLILDNGAQVGINTRTFLPNVLLTVNGSVSATHIRGDGHGLTNLNATNFTSGTLAVQRGGTGLSALVVNHIYRAASTTAFAPGSIVDNGTHVIIAGNGRNPTSTLTVNGTTFATQWIGGAGSVTNLNAATFSLGILPTSFGGTGLSNLALNSIYRLSNNAFVPGIITDTGTRIGVNTTNPQTDLDVSGNIHATAWVGSAQGVHSLNIENASFGTMNVQVGGTGISAYQPNLIYYASASNILAPSPITDIGTNVGISTTNPRFLLDVNGSVRATTFIGNARGIMNLSMSNVGTGILQVAFGGLGPVAQSLSAQAVLYAANSTSWAYNNVITDNGGFGVGIYMPTPVQTFDVGLNVVARTFSGQITNVTNLNATNVASGLLRATNGGTGLTSFVPNRIYYVNSNIGGNSFIESPFLVDTGSSIGINSTSPVNTIDVQGRVVASQFIGSGSGLSNWNMNNVTTGVLNVHAGGTGLSLLQKGAVYKRIPGQSTLIPTSIQDDVNRIGILGPSRAGNVMAVGAHVFATSFASDGNALTNLNATNINEGIVSVARGGLGGNGTWTPGTILRAISPTEFGSGALTDTGVNIGILTSQPSTALQVGGNIIVNTIIGSGAGLQNLNATNFTFGVLQVAQGGFGIQNTAFAVNSVLRAVSSNQWGTGVITDTGLAVGIGTLQPTSTLQVNGAIMATNFIGTGCNISQLNISNVVQGLLTTPFGGTGLSSFEPNAVYKIGPQTLVPTLITDTGSFVGINTTLPSATLDVRGTMRAASFIGQGILISDINGTNVTHGTLQPSVGGLGIRLSQVSPDSVLRSTGTSFAESLYRDTGTVVSINATTGNPSISLNVGGAASATLWIGSGQAISGINVTNINAGVLPVEFGGTGLSSLSSGAIYRVNATGSFVPSSLTYTPAALGAVSLHGAMLSNRQEINVIGNVAATIFIGNGGGLTNINLSADTSGVLNSRFGGTGITSLTPNAVYKVSLASSSPWELSSLRVSQSEQRVGVHTSTPTTSLDVLGTLRASRFIGSGEGIASLNANNITSGTLPVQYGGTGLGNQITNNIFRAASSSNIGAGALVDTGSFVGINTTNPTALLDVVGTVRATAFVGIGSLLTNLNVANVSTGTLATVYGGTGLSSLSSNAVYTIQGNQFVQSPITDTGSKIGIGTSTNLVETLTVNGTVTASTWSGSGTALTNINLLNVTSGTALPVASGGTGLSSLQVNRIYYALTTSNFAPSIIASTGSFIGIQTSAPRANLDVVGTTRATTFIGSGGALSELFAPNFTTGFIMTTAGGIGTTSLRTNAVYRTMNNAFISDVITDTGVAVGINSSIPRPGYALDVRSSTNSIIRSTLGFAGNGGALGSLNIANISVGLLQGSVGGLGTSTTVLSQYLLRAATTNQFVTSTIFDSGSRVGIASVPVAFQLEVSGNVRSHGFIGSMSTLPINLTNVVTGILSWSHGGTGISSFTPNAVYASSSNGFVRSIITDTGLGVGINTTEPRQSSLDVNGVITSTSFVGSGAALSLTRASHFTAGHLPVSLGGIGVQGASLPVNGVLYALSTSSFSSTSPITDTGSAVGINTTQPVPGVALTVNGTVGKTGTTFTGSAAGMNNINVANISTGILSVSHGGIGTNVTTPNTSFRTTATTWSQGAMFLGTNVGINTTSDPGKPFVVFGNVRATTFVGSGQALQGLNAANFTMGVLPIVRGGLGTSTLQNNTLVKTDPSGTAFVPSIITDSGTTVGIFTTAPTSGIALDVNGIVRAGTFIGIGSNLTSINVTNVSSGTLLPLSLGGTGVGPLSVNSNAIYKILGPDSLQPSIITDLQPFVGINQPNPTVQLDVNGIASATQWSGNGTALSMLNLNNMSIAATLGAQFGGTGLSNLVSNSVYRALNSTTWVPGNITDTGSAVGIQTTNPQTTLDVNGQIRATTLVGSAAAINAIPINSVIGMLVPQRGGMGTSAFATNAVYFVNTTGEFVPSRIIDTGASIGINTTLNPRGILDVNGTFGATSFTGIGSGLTNLNATRFTSGLLQANHGGFGMNVAVQTGRTFTTDEAGVLGLTYSRLNVIHQTDAIGIGTDNTSSGTILGVAGIIRATNLVGSIFSPGSTINIPFGNVTSGSALGTVRGGTGLSSLIQNAVYRASSTSALVPGLIIDTGSSIGINTTSPSASFALDVNGTVRATNFVGNANAISAINIANTTSGTLRVSQGGTGLSTVTSNLLYRTSNQAYVPGVIFDNNAQVGINTTIPRSGAILDVFGTFRSTSLQGNLAPLTTWNATNVISGTLAPSFGGTGLTSLVPNSLYKIDTQGNLTPSIITEVGTLVGIGSSAPIAKLDVSGTITATSYLGVGTRLQNLNVTNTIGGPLTPTFGGTGISTTTLAANSVYAAASATQIKETKIFDVSGLVGINKTNPTSTLDVNGAVAATQFIGNGTGLTQLNARNILTGTLSVSQGGLGNLGVPTTPASIATPLVAATASTWKWSSFGTDALGKTGFGYVMTSLTNSLFPGNVTVTVNGTVNATGFTVKAPFPTGAAHMQLQNLNSTNVSTGIFSATVGGTGQSALVENAVYRYTNTGTFVPGSIRDNGTNVGIGSTMPIARLDVSGTTRATIFITSNALGITALNAANVAQGILSGALGGTGIAAPNANSVYIYLSTGAFSETLWKDRGGNVGYGIAETSITERLSMGSLPLIATRFAGQGHALTSLNATNITGAALPVILGGTNLSTLTTNRLYSAFNGAFTPGIINVNATTASVGIGTGIPRERLDVEGAMFAQTYVGDATRITNLNATNVSTGSLSLSHGGTGLTTYVTNTVYRAAGAATWSSGMITDTGTRVGIGSIYPTQTLDINGTLFATSFSGDFGNATNVEQGYVGYVANSTAATMGSRDQRFASVHGTDIGGIQHRINPMGTYFGPDISSNTIGVLGNPYPSFAVQGTAHFKVPQYPPVQTATAGITATMKLGASLAMTPDRRVVVLGSHSNVVDVYTYQDSTGSYEYFRRLTPRIGLGTSAITYGKTVDISWDGHVVLVTAPDIPRSSNGSTLTPGGVYIYDYKLDFISTSDASWTETFIVPNNALNSTNHFFGKEACLSGDGKTAIITQACTVAGTNAEQRIYIYKRINYSWIQHSFCVLNDIGAGPFSSRTLVASAMGDRFLYSIPTSTSGGFANAGQAYLFRHSSDTENYAIQQTFTMPTPAANSYYGFQVDMSEDAKTIAISAPYTSTNQGSVYVYSANSNGAAYTLVSTLGTGTRSYFGTQISLSRNGNTLFVIRNATTLDQYQFVMANGANPAWVLMNQQTIPSTVQLPVAPLYLPKTSLIASKDGSGVVLGNTDTGANGQFCLIEMEDQPSFQINRDTFIIKGSNVGIKTSSPLFPLDVLGTMRGTTFVGSGAALSSLNAANVTIGLPLNTVQGGTGLTTVVRNAYYKFTGTAALAPTTLIMDNGTRVGVNTTSPTDLLHVNGIIQATRFIGSGQALSSLNATNIAVMVNLLAGGTGLSTLAQNAVFRIGSGNTLLAGNLFDTGSIQVGIGTQYPLTNLNVTRPSPSNFISIYSQTAAVNAGLQFVNINGSTATLSWQVYRPANTHTDLRFRTATADQFRFTSDGAFVCAGDIAGFATIYSDARLKKHVTAIPTNTSMEIIRNIHPVTFEWNKNAPYFISHDKLDVGFIAQHLEPIAPYVVENAETLVPDRYADYKAVKYDKLLVYSIGALQTLLDKYDMIKLTMHRNKH